MKIVKLVAERVKRLSAVEITPEGNVVEIAGMNAQGKTSVLDAIWYALGGTEHLPSQPIRRGEKDARIEVTLGDGTGTRMIVERRFTEKGSYLSVKNADGFKATNPQTLLNGLLGALTFDPLDFMRRKPLEQAAILRSLVKLDIDIDATDKAIKEAQAERTNVNRDVKFYHAQVDAISVAADLPPDRIDEGKLLDEIENAANSNSEIERKRANREAARVKITTDKGKVSDLRDRADRELKDARRRAAEIIQDAEKRKLALAAEAQALEASIAATEQRLTEAGELPLPMDVSALKSKLTQAQDINRKISERARKQTAAAEADKLDHQSEALTNKIKSLQQAKIDALAKANMPIDGLGIEDGTLTFGGLPLDQASDAEQLMISTSIAAALNPKLGVIRIRDGSLLDDDAFKRLAKFAEDHNLQIWIESVGSGHDASSIIIEDGHIKGQEPQLVAAE